MNLINEHVSIKKTINLTKMVKWSAEGDEMWTYIIQEGSVEITKQTKLGKIVWRDIHQGPFSRRHGLCSKAFLATLLLMPRKTKPPILKPGWILLKIVAIRLLAFEMLQQPACG